MSLHSVAPLGKPIDFAPATLRDEVLQNVATILATPRFSAPFARQLGVDPQYLDDPTPVARARAVADITEAIHRHEPRCRVESVSFEADEAEGRLRPIVRVRING